MLMALFVVALCVCGQAEEKTKSSETSKEKTDGVPILFDGKTLEGWEVTDFGGQGSVIVKDGAIILEQGEPITGLTWKGAAVPTSNYEIHLEAKRVEGNDFFCALTFPVKKKSCTLVLGGWGGGVMGLSSIDGFDASENETTQYYSFESGKWYKLRLRVTDAKIEAWLGKEKIANVELEGKDISVRIEMELSKPIGLASFQTVGAVRKLKLVKLDPKTGKPVKSAKKKSKKKEGGKPLPNVPKVQGSKSSPPPIGIDLK